MALEMKIEKCPTEELSVTNRLVVNKHDFDTIFQKARHVEVGVMNKRFVFSVEPFDRLTPGVLGFSNVQRKFAMVTLGQRVNVRPFQFDLKSQSLVSVTLQVDFFNPRQATQEPYDTDKMAVLFRESFPGIALATNEPLVFRIPDKKMLVMTVTHLEALDVSGKNRPVNIGQLSGNCVITFEKADNSSINLTGKAKGKQSFQSVINPDWNFTQMGIGGLDNEFSGIFRRAFASRVFPPEVVQQIGMKHCRGILLYGPPGTGKTLMARQIGKMLNSREPKIVNGPQILDKYVGESEANIRKLFQEAEDEEKKLGVNSGLHIIIFDEIDAICKARGSVSGSTAVHDTVVNQLLSKIDGVDQLNNILVIGMTNRKDMIDEALLRPGRLEVQMEIGLPNEAGRVQILNIHTTKMRDNDKLAADVDIAELAKETKNFSGAEIEGLVRAAAATAMNRLIKAKSKVEIDPDAVDKLKVTRADFMHSLANDVKPAFGVSLEELEMHVANGIMNWGEEVQHLLREGELLVHQTRTCAETPLVSLIITGSKGSGKTALAAQIARLSEFPFLKICSPKTMIGYHEAAKCQTIKKVFDDAYKSHLSCIVLDDIERLLDYVSIGQRFSNLVLQTLLVLLNNVPPKGHRLLVLGTTSESSILKEMGLYQSFNSHVHVACLNEPHHVSNALRELRAFGEDVIHAIEHKLEQALQSSRKLRIGIKRLLTVVGETKQVPSDQYVYKFITILEEEGYLQ